ncbi:MAG: hypothetical protein ACOY3Y_11575 [Acidobacteriota bacterium]
MSPSRPVLLLVAVAVSALTSCGGAIAPPSEMVGAWKGTAEVACSWCTTRELAVTLTIGADGTVTGRIGDATLAGGRLARNTSPPAKRMGAPTRYVVRATMTGPIVASEGISRESISIFVDVSGGALIGGFRTSGQESGDRATALLAGSLREVAKG